MARKTKKRSLEIYQRNANHISIASQQLMGKGYFEEDKWNRPEGGGGARTIESFEMAKLLKKENCLFCSTGPTPNKILSKTWLDRGDFFATGVSIGIHPQSPMVPIIHIWISGTLKWKNGVHWRFGGDDPDTHITSTWGCYLFSWKIKSHLAKQIFELVGYYDRFKSWQMITFSLNTGIETRGIGGIFYDRTRSQHLDIRILKIYWNSVWALGRLFPENLCAFMRRKF